MKKFELTGEFITNIFGTKLFRIKALLSFGDISEGDIGGYIEKEENLSHEGDAWVSGNAEVSGNAKVTGNAWVAGNAWVYGDAEITGNAKVAGNAKVSGYAWVSGNAEVYGNAKVADYAEVYGNAKVAGNAEVSGDAEVSGNAKVSGDAWVSGNNDYACAKGFGRFYRNTTFFRTKVGELAVVCGCFLGTIAEFREKIKETHGDTKLAKEYLMLADLMEYHFSKEDEA